MLFVINDIISRKLFLESVLYWVKCEECKGAGIIWIEEKTVENGMYCNRCSGHGKLSAEEHIAMVKLRKT